MSAGEWNAGRRGLRLRKDVVIDKEGTPCTESKRNAIGTGRDRKVVEHRHKKPLAEAAQKMALAAINATESAAYERENASELERLYLQSIDAFNAALAVAFEVDINGSPSDQNALAHEIAIEAAAREISRACPEVEDGVEHWRDSGGTVLPADRHAVDRAVRFLENSGLVRRHPVKSSWIQLTPMAEWLTRSPS